MQRKYVSYLRVSTARQGASGLGLEAQREAVANYLQNGTLLAEIVEIESGKRNDRPQIAEALRLCRVHRATLVIAKLDRLARNLHFISSLMESGVEFIACDFPQANRLTVHILAAVAEHEAEAISNRTKAALQAAKHRGTTLGGLRVPLDRMAVIAAEGCRVSAQCRSLRAARQAADTAVDIEAARAAGCASLRQIAAYLTERNVPTPTRKGVWSATQVQRVMQCAV